MAEPELPTRLDADAAGEVIRRAAELDQTEVTPGGGFDRRSLEAAAAEVGISVDAMRRALAEHDAGTLGAPETGRSLLGPARARVTRSVELPVSIARDRVDRWLKAQMLQVHRRSDGEVEWRRREDLPARLWRKLDPTKRVRLGSVDGVIASVVDAGAGRAVVRLDATLEHTRSGLRTGVVGVPTVVGPLAGGAAAWVLGEPLLLAAGVPVGLALGGTGVYVARKTLSTEREEARRVLELFLDGLDRR